MNKRLQWLAIGYLNLCFSYLALKANDIESARKYLELGEMCLKHQYTIINPIAYLVFRAKVDQ